MGTFGALKHLKQVFIRSVQDRWAGTYWFSNYIRKITYSNTYILIAMTAWKIIEALTLPSSAIGCQLIDSELQAT